MSKVAKLKTYDSAYFRARVQGTYPTRQHWVPDNQATVCMQFGCSLRFNAINRRHHCRRCGKIFCASHLNCRMRLGPNSQPSIDGVLCLVCSDCSLASPVVTDSDSVSDNTPRTKVYVAITDFPGTEEGDLPFRAGDRITVLFKDEIWWTGRVGTNTGNFPRSFVKPATKMDQPSAAEEAEFFFARYDFNGLAAGDLSFAAEYYLALHDFEGEEEGDLRFRQGARIEVIEKDGQWWKGISNGNTGMFPSNYVAKE